MADYAKDGFNPTSMGRNPDGMRKSNPSWGFGTSTRAHAKKVYLSEHLTQDILGTHSPGPIYATDKYKDGLAPGPRWGFGTGKRPPLSNPNKFPPTSSDLLKIQLPPDYIYKNQMPPTAKMGTSTREACINAPDLDGFTPGKISPGPAGYNPNFFAANHKPPEFSMGKKLHIGLSKYEKRPAPNAYAAKTTLGRQGNGRVHNRPTWVFSKAPRFKENRDAAMRIKDPSGDDDGNLRLKFQRNANAPPNLKFGTGTRSQRQRLAMAMLKEDDTAAIIKAKHNKCDDGMIPTNAHMPRHRDVLKYTEIQ